MPRLAAFVALAVLALVPEACKRRPEGTLKVLVIGSPPSLRDPADGPLTQPQQVLALNVAQGLVSFDSSGNIVSGLAERWTVTDDGLGYIFRLASANWPDGRKITAKDVARLLKREIAGRSRNSLKDAFGAVEEIVPMTDRVLEINLIAPRPDLLSLLAQPQMAILRNQEGTGPFTGTSAADGQIRLKRNIVSPEDETTTREELLLGGAPSRVAIQAFAALDVDLVLGGTFADLPEATRAKLPRNSLRFDPASGLFGLLPTRSEGPLGKPEVRQLLSQAIDRDSFVAALGVPGLAPRATVLEPGLDGLPAPTTPSWTTTAYSDRVAGLKAQASRLFGKGAKPTVRIALPDGPGANLLFVLLRRDWGELGFSVERAQSGSAADFTLVDEVAPSTGASWFVRHFRCDRTSVCDPKADQLMDGARQSPVPAQRYALLGQAAALIDGGELFIPIAAPVRWSLVSASIQNFVGNRYARHTLSELETGPSGG
ncbi:MAG TPA: ABC transporter substrate-binding protein [Sphingomicrobium sp.]|jgi:peptide/nickel transport system substrate-binding protein|nr:ABC transporter substrate-binding protein [Sphingomicrobium sp.]